MQTRAEPVDRMTMSDQEKLLRIFSPFVNTFSKCILVTIFFCRFRIGIRRVQYPSISMGMFMSVINIIGHHDVYYFDYSADLQPLSIFSRILFIANCSVNFFSWYMVYEYGLGDFSRVALSGNFSVGFKLYYASRFGAPTSIFYPVDKMHEKLVVQKDGYKSFKRWLDYKNVDFYLIN